MKFKQAMVLSNLGVKIRNGWWHHTCYVTNLRINPFREGYYIGKDELGFAYHVSCEQANKAKWEIYNEPKDNAGTSDTGIQNQT